MGMPCRPATAVLFARLSASLLPRDLVCRLQHRDIVVLVLNPASISPKCFSFVFECWGWCVGLLMARSFAHPSHRRASTGMHERYLGCCCEHWFAGGPHLSPLSQRQPTSPGHFSTSSVDVNIAPRSSPTLRLRVFPPLQSARHTTTNNPPRVSHEAPKSKARLSPKP
ncbi:uncharacterized protein K460DRAFT_79794 [Cucurbitaria berberidis CBS 394.84]|uniref:Secreted protein n=1 Tax=Cucurbitaria berberidis CBS 394.84 TaxID=1168544 RepID=A0A9P4LAR7_9PLEO|nr:uncharacterized protein K460DRAFT_79794 [Cucurbitaria berberidis CBS 394.84]KAF1848691.1 hypothetical protein K460DRAFT_79794 [Cucurbitaria berberidis CBS 394.84]